MRKILNFLWKLPLCGIGFFSGLIISGMALPALGFQAPEIPAGTDANTITFYFLLGSIVLAFVLSFISRNLQSNWLGRWLILAALTLVFAVVGMVLESFFFMTTGAVSSLTSAIYTTLNFLLPSLFLAALIALLFHPIQSFETCSNCLRNFFSSHSSLEWLWRITLALVAYPLTYFTFGLLMLPYVRDFYISGQFELVNPTWGRLIPLQLIRSLLFLIASLPVIIWWRGSRWRLWLALGISVFVLTAFMAVFTAYWFPWQMRFFHGLELFADAMVYVGALVMLFARKQPSAKSDKSDWSEYPTAQV